jgi:hypothetical protein
MRPTLDWLIRGSGCQNCSAKKAGIEKRITEEKFLLGKDRVLTENKILILSPYSDYKQAHSHLSCKCQVCGSEFFASMTNLLSGKGCRSCSISERRTAQEDFNLFSGSVCDKILIKTPFSLFRRSDQKLDCECSTCGKEFGQSFRHLKLGHLCPSCGHQAGGDKLRLEREEYEIRVLEILNSKQIQVLTRYEDYLSSSQRAECKCLTCGKTIQPPFKNLFRGSGCIECWKEQSTSEGEFELLSFIRGIVQDLEVEQGNRTILSGKEIDVLVQSLNVGFEYHGLYWHSEVAGKPKNYHLDKYESAKNNGVKLIQIFSDEWENKREIVKSIIAHSLGKTSNRLFARKCEIVELTANNKSRFVEFFEKNHIAGNTRFFAAFALEYQGEIVSAVSFRKPFTKRHEGAVELARSCSKLNTSVVGGFGKLLAHATKTLEARKILSYADLRFGTGEVYLKNGFILAGQTGPDYWYTDFISRYNRFKFRARDGKSESEVAKDNNVCKIHGPGSNVYVLEVNPVLP